MSSDRYLAHLVQLAQKHAPHLLTQATPDVAGRALLANGLARLGYVVVCVQLQGDVAELAQTWVRAFAQAYHALAQALFAPFTAFKAAYLDSQSPTLLLLEMECSLLAHSLARTFIPYLALLSHGYKSSRAELDGLMNALLEELLADELDAAQRKDLQQRLYDSLAHLTQLPQTCYSLQTFRRPDLVAAQAAIARTQPPSLAAPAPAPRPKTGPLDYREGPLPPLGSDSKIFMPVPDPPRRPKKD
ncbi:MAG: hypothetical protein NZ750_09750 [Anaerolineae bacterium]|nr:hypothetical protein [Anaerolineae bacterium]MDW8171904.1 hypothetical protein [Anaerolineae bacterium]